MHKLKALTTLQWLAKGKNPITKKSLPNESIYHNSEVSLALLIAIQALEAQVAREQQTLSEEPYAFDIAMLRQQTNVDWNSTSLIESEFSNQEVVPTHENTHAKKKASTPPNAGKPWNKEEDEALIRAFDAGTPIQVLATKHERTTGAITSRLLRHGRMTINLENQAADPFNS